MRAANARLRREGGSVPRSKPESDHVSQGAPARGELLRIDEEVVHDLSHELGNYFHKLFYWTDYIRSGATDLGPDSSPAQALDETMHRMQDFLNLALEYFQPARLNGVTMKVGDVAGALESLLRGENPEATVATVCPAEIAGASLVVDTTRLSAGLRIIARLLGGGHGTTLRAHFDGTRPDALEIVLSTSGGSAEAAARRAQRVVEWSVASRMIELHGGRLVTNEESHDGASCVVTLPLAI